MKNAVDRLHGPLLTHHLPCLNAQIVTPQVLLLENPQLLPRMSPAFLWNARVLVFVSVGTGKLFLTSVFLLKAYSLRESAPSKGCWQKVHAARDFSWVHSCGCQGASIVQPPRHVCGVGVLVRGDYKSIGRSNMLRQC